MKVLHFVAAFVVMLGLATVVVSSPRQSPFVTKMSRQDGDKRSGIYVSCSSTTWTAILPAKYERRRAVLETLSGADTVCLSTITTAAVICTTATPGLRLVASSPKDDFSQGVEYCRAADTKAAVSVYGMEYYDSGDSTTGD